MTRKITPKRLQEIADEITERIAGESERGVVADYIPELAKVDLNRFGIAILPVETEECIVAGDADVPFSIQSISKVFALTLALEKVGATLWSRVGREPSGDPFNSIVQLEYEKGIPRNPFINPGAIVLADVLMDNQGPDKAIEQILGLCQRLANDQSMRIDGDVAASEMKTGGRNRALAHFMAAEGNLRGDVEDVLKIYFHQCSIAMSCRQLAMAGRFLASAGHLSGGEDPTVTPERARRINALMMTCGQYDASGEFAFRIGIPAKSGVGGGILGIVPGIASVVAWCPGLDAKGNSLLATRAFEELVRTIGWSVFGPI
ncbi:glutaminase [Qingshengfaniella alkalisoli]|uniref:Glutaminase n=1 Tax=Qingshengfaniella alkalisoli TaxID=2599296 RepID=A0A5B8ISS6_9RHOB|nr:glutaminase [Qingshengfaniella alkalisoli]QDY68483.1 glutaminase [Qingshengfaniella alkalisoli]